MKTTHLLHSILFTAVLLTGCGTRVITGNSLHVQGSKLRKTAAFRTQILQVGRKVSAGTNSFSPYDFLNTDGGLPVTVTTSFKVNEVSTWLTELGLTGAPEVSEAKATAKGTTKNEGTFSVVSIQTKRPLLDLLQAPENRELVEWLSQTPGARIITAVATTRDHKNVRERELEGTVTASLSVVGAGPGSGTVHVKSTRNSTLEFTDGTVFAYEMSMPAWSRDTQGRLYIADVVEDRPGTRNPKPVPGTFLDPQDVPPNVP